MSFINRKGSTITLFFFIVGLVLFPMFSYASVGGIAPAVFGFRIEFVLFALTLIGVAVFHKQTFWVAVCGLLAIVLYKFIFISDYNWIDHFFGQNSFISQFADKGNRQGEWGILLNLMGLLLGFSILAKIFEQSGVPEILPKYLPDDWKGPFVLLIFVFVLSSFLDNIAGAMIGGAIALVVFKRKVHLGYIVGIVAASNAGGAGSVLGDTTTTMMWIDGVSALDVLHAYIAASVAFLIFAWFASHQQDKYQRINKDASQNTKIDWGRLFTVFLMLVGAIASNILYDMPALGVWIAVVIGAAFSKIPWREVSLSIKGTVFLICLVTAASLMPVETLPDASLWTAFILGFVSAVFDNIPLTKICLDQGHYDWGMLAYAVGFGGSMIWFGSSAGVALTNKFPEARNVTMWLKKGWHVIPAYIIGFFVMFLIWGWHPSSNKEHKEPAIDCSAKGCNVAEKAQLKWQIEK
jgi:Na+/H+ antiporter NhaD/arsenite permease-like protein